jgi:hypothetical protein
LNWKGDFSGALGKIHKLQLGLTSNALTRGVEAEMLAEAKQRIPKRTQSGLDKNDQPFKGYSSQYQKYKVSKGRKGNVDLVFSGAMFQALQSKVELIKNTLIGSVFVSAEQADKARRHIRGDGVPKRDFLGFTKICIKRINRLVRDAFNGR